MTVVNNGYLKKEDVYKLDKPFGIYFTNKKTYILLLEHIHIQVYLYQPDYGRVPYSNEEGKKICNGTLVYDSTKDNISKLENIKWNNGNQIMSYYPFSISI